MATFKFWVQSTQVHYLNGLTPGFDGGPLQLLLYDIKIEPFRIIDFDQDDSEMMCDINLISYDP